MNEFDVQQSSLKSITAEAFEQYQPENSSIKIWRYMDFTKLIAMFQNGGLYFSRADNLGDSFEGSMPRANRVRKDTLFATDDPRNADHPEFVKLLRKLTYVNCWHASEHESEAMWRLYGHEGQTLAIQSTYDRLIQVTDEQKIGKSVQLGKVQYIDYEVDLIEDFNLFTLYLHKRKSFEHEREIRALAPLFDGTLSSTGQYLRIPLEDLIDAVYVDPSTDDWFKDVVQKSIHDMGYNFTVMKSTLTSEPEY